MKLLLMRLRGAIGNAVFWGIVWFAIGLVVVATESLLSTGGLFLAGLIAQAMFAAVLGALTGGVFSLYVAARFRRMRVKDLRASQFSLGGVMIGVLVGLLLQLWFARGSVFFPPSIGEALAGMAVYGAIGGVTALGSIKIAQRSLPPFDPAQPLESRGQRSQLESSSV